MDLLELIKKRATTRQYQDKHIPKDILDKIIEAGVWGPSVIGIQPWKYVIITKKENVQGLNKILLQKSETLGVGGNILNSMINTLVQASVLVIVYNTQEASKRVQKISEKYFNIVKLAEVEAISASIQNMLLVAEDLNIGSCWFDIPLICENSINKFLGENDSLVALLAFGYATRRNQRAKRKKTVRYF